MNTSWQTKKKSVYLNLSAVFLVILIAAIYFFWPEIVRVLKNLPEGGKGILWGVVAFLLLAASTRLWRRLKNFLELEKINNLTDPKDFFSARLELIKAGAQILGGMFFLIGLWFTYQNLIVAQEKNVTDLFT
jgi:hypothetical protein